MIKLVVFCFSEVYAYNYSQTLTINIIDPSATTTTVSTTTTIPSSTTTSVPLSTTTTIAATTTTVPTTTTTTIGVGGGGGGGGGGNQNNNINLISTAVVLKGKAYPLSSVTLLKDSQVVGVTKAGPDANFTFSLSGLSAGDYMFSVYSQDKNQSRSNLLTFPIKITLGVTTEITGVFLSPTLSADKQQVRKGDKIVLFGQTVPSSEIVITVRSEEINLKTKADKSGVYLYNLDTSDMDIGSHLARSRATNDGFISPNSRGVGFVVGNKNILNVVKQQILKGDLNKDGKVNLIDFSIAAY